MMKYINDILQKKTTALSYVLASSLNFFSCIFLLPSIPQQFNVLEAQKCCRNDINSLKFSLNST